MHVKTLISVICGLVLLSGCRTTELLEIGDLRPSDITPQELADKVPDYSRSLNTISGSGRAIVSQPGNSDTVTLEFQSNRRASLVYVRNRLGIEGAQILVERDSVLIYNRIDNIAERVSVEDGNLSQAGSLATINLIDLFHYPFPESDIEQIAEDEQYYVAGTSDNSRIVIDKETGRILDIQASVSSDAPYSRIVYEEYDQLNNFYLPRKITIFSSDGASRVTFLVRELDVNPTLPPLTISIPEDTIIQIL